MRSVHDFHAGLKPRPAEAFLSLRALAVSLGPDVVERVVNSGNVTYLRRTKPFVSVQVVKTKLHVSFPPGLPLDDPSGRLLRRGDERYVVVEGPESVDGHLQAFIRKAYIVAR